MHADSIRIEPLLARHNRSGSGVDQRGFSYRVDYQPDWLRKLKVTRKLRTGRQSTKSLFRNPSDHRCAETGDRVRTAVHCKEQNIDFEVSIRDPHGAIRQVTVTYEIPADGDARGSGRTRRRRQEQVVFTLEDGLKPPAAR